MMVRRALIGAVLLGLCAVTAVPAAGQSEDNVQTAPSARPANPFAGRRGYIDPASYPNSLALLPPPPAPGSASLARDEAVRADARRQRTDDRWTRATSDANLQFPQVAQVFACAANVTISQESTPRLYALLNKTFVDLAASTYAAKNHYERARPFTTDSSTTCTPANEARQRHDGAYPSGHSAIGWGWSLILSELVPDRTDALLARGRDFGQSRVVCDVHWQSDVDAGRVIAAGTVARLHGEPAFLADMAAARVEIETARASRRAPESSACAAEEASLR